MKTQIANAKEHFIQGMSRISSFWGFPKSMGAIYGAIYLSPDPVSLNEIMEEVGVSKGAVSTNVRHLERLGMVHKHIEVGERKDFYYAETDFWKIGSGILREREKSEFDRALKSVGESLEYIDSEPSKVEDKETVAFYRQRMGTMQTFFNTLDSLVGAVLALEGLMSLSALKNLVVKVSKEN